MIVLELLLALAGLPLALCCAYLLLLTLLSAKTRLPGAAPQPRRFRVVVPAHDEAAGIAATVESLRALDYPAGAFDVLVVADNCTDDTAARARAAGAEVLERTHLEQRGKGYALAYAFERLSPEIDAVVVIDADTLVSKNLLRAMTARRDAGAHAVQVDYAVRNPHASWRTRLMTIAFGCFHIVRSRGRERLGVSCGLRGNGMCFSREVLSRVPHHAFSIVEDVEYGLRLGEAGYRVYYADEAHVYGEMVSSGAAARSQRQRWEEGRAELVRRNGLRLLRAGLRSRKPVLIDLALDLLIPPLSRLVMLTAFGLVLTLGLCFWTGSVSLSLAPFAFSACALLLYVMRGWMVSGTGARGILDLALSPVYVLWKLGISRRRARQAPETWVRTQREREEAGTGPG